MSKDIETARCPGCGALLVLVGLRHLCREPLRTADARGRGRPLLGVQPMTAAERKRRQRAKKKA